MIVKTNNGPVVLKENQVFMTTGGGSRFGLYRLEGMGHDGIRLRDMDKEEPLTVEPNWFRSYRVHVVA